MAEPRSTASILEHTLKAAKPPRPKNPRPIVLIGAGGIVRDAHLPAYAKAGFPVVAVIDPIAGKAEELATKAGIPRAFSALPEAVQFAPADAVFDIAVPATEIPDILPHLPDGAPVLIQKPMGETFEDAKRIRDLCRQKSLVAAVNFQLRYAPLNLAARALFSQGVLGDLHDMEVQVRTYMPWQLWAFMATAPRLEILYHSIHYLDLVRSWLGNPLGVYAKTVRNPMTPKLAATKSSIILDYGDWKRVFIVTSHAHDFADTYQRSFVQWEGTEGAMRAVMGVNLDYPKGKTDTLEFVRRSEKAAGWQSCPLSGNWFPDAFMGSMGALQAYAEGSVAELPSSFEDAYQTMALVEAAYTSSAALAQSLLLD